MECSYGYDSAGQRINQFDARGVQTSYQHDALGRLTLIDYGSASLNVQLHYDEPNAVTGCSASHPVGRLTRMLDASGQTAWCYDAHGRISAKQTMVSGQALSIGYRYDGDGRLIGLRYPSGGELQIVRDAAGRPTRADWAPVSGPVVPVLTQISHLPFGPISALQFGNGLSQLRHFDADYRLTAIDGLDLAGGDRRFAYDALQRLAQEANADGSDATGYAYDGIGNRLAKVTDAGTDVYGYAANSHRLLDVAGQTRSYDAAGNTTAIGAQSLSYDARNRLVGYVGAQTASYQYNGRGERVQKQVGGVTRRFAYDEAGHLLGEYGSGGAARQEFLWLDDLPIGVVQSDGSVLSVQADHLQTPRALADAAGTLVWRWALGGDAFGGDVAESDPDGNGVSVEFNLRFPGQQFDVESGLHYNYFRDYDATTGRYIESDPIGLNGGINTFAYVGGNPLGSIDSLGLISRTACCDKAIELGLDKNHKDPSQTDRGFVACCEGKKFACYSVDETRVTDTTAKSSIRSCGRKHERDHFEEVTCQGCGTHRPGRDNADEEFADQQECKARRIALECLESKLKTCPAGLGGTLCRSQIGGEVSRVKGELTIQCGG